MDSIVHGIVKESDTTARLSFSLSFTKQVSVVCINRPMRVAFPVSFHPDYEVGSQTESLIVTLSSWTEIPS